MARLKKEDENDTFLFECAAVCVGFQLPHQELLLAKTLTHWIARNPPASSVFKFRFIQGADAPCCLDSECTCLIVCLLFVS